MNTKIELINEYISKCTNCTEPNMAQKLSEEIIGVFDNEIKDITSRLDAYDLLRIYDNSKPIDYMGDIKLLKAKLINYKSTLEYEIEKQDKKSPLIAVNQNTNVSINISLEQTINEIESISDSKLSQDDKELLEGKLTKLSTEKDKTKLWEKAQSTLKWIADKSIEVGIAALPYIAEAIKNVK